MIGVLGNEYTTLPCYLLDDVWNQKHGDIFIIMGTDNYDKSIERIKETCKLKKVSN